MNEKFSLKDHLFNEVKVRYLAEQIARVHEPFLAQQFVTEVMGRLLILELKDRIRWIAEVLEKHLPTDYEIAVAIVTKALPPPLDPNQTDGDFGDFIFAPFGEYVVRRGCTKERLAVSLISLRELTMRFSMEDAIRYFLRAFPAETLKIMHQWVHDDNYHVRRLVSEGTRPRLPWSGRVEIPWAVRRKLLTLLHSDVTRYVVRSVANHLNDEAKENPHGVLAVVAEWQQANKATQKELMWLTRHALRTLIKIGHPDTLEFLGYHAGQVHMVEFAVSPSVVRMGERVSLKAEITSQTDVLVLIDYRIGFVKKTGECTDKVFKWTIRSVKKAEPLILNKTHLLKADATTFKLYPGEHTLAVQINGEVHATTKFILTDQ